MRQGGIPPLVVSASERRFLNSPLNPQNLAQRFQDGITELGVKPADPFNVRQWNGVGLQDVAGKVIALQYDLRILIAVTDEDVFHGRNEHPLPEQRGLQTDSGAVILALQQRFKYLLRFRNKIEGKVGDIKIHNLQAPRPDWNQPGKNEKEEIRPRTGRFEIH